MNKIKVKCMAKVIVADKLCDMNFSILAMSVGLKTHPDAYLDELNEDLLSNLSLNHFWTTTEQLPPPKAHTDTHTVRVGLSTPGLQHTSLKFYWLNPKVNNVA